MLWFSFGVLMTLVGLVLMLTADTTPLYEIYGFSVLISIGRGCIFRRAFGCASNVIEIAALFLYS